MHPDNVHLHPTAIRAVMPPPDDPDTPAAAALPVPPGFRQREYSIFDIARFLGIYDRSSRTIIRHVRDMIALRDMPAPKGFRIVRPRKGQDLRPQVLEGADAVTLRSRWDAPLYDAWRRSRLSPVQRATLDTHETSIAGRTLDANAGRIYG